MNIFEKIPALVIIWDLKNQSVINANKNIYSFFGYSPKDGCNQSSWKELVHLDDLAAIISKESQITSSLGINSWFTQNVRIKMPDNSWQYFTFNESVYESLPDQNLLHGIIFLTPNEFARDLELSLRESNERFKTLADASFGGIGIHDKGKIIEANQELARMSGYEHHELIGMDGLLLITPEQRDIVMGRIVDGYEKPYESVGIRKDGSKYSLEIQGKQIPYKGKIVRVTEFRNIDDRKLAEKAIQTMEQNYENIIEFAVDGILIGDPKGVVVKANKRFLEITGRQREEVEGNHISNLFKKQILENRPLRFDVLQSGETLVNEREIIKPNGDKVIVEMHSKMMLDGTYQSIVRDITKRKMTEEALLDSENLYRSIIENITDVYYRFNSDSMLTMVSPSGVKLMGYSNSNDLIGKHLREFWNEKEHVQQFFDLLRKSGRVKNFETTITGNDNRKIFISLSASYLRDENGTIVGTEGIIRDISHRKKAEEALASEQHFMQTLMNNVPDQIYFKDIDSKFIRVNHNVAKRFGLDNPMDVIGKNDFDFFASEHAQIAFDTEQNIIKTGKPVVGIEEQEKWPDGSITWVSTTKMPLRDKNGTIVGTFGVSRDITDRKLAEEALRESEAKLRLLSDNLPLGLVFQIDSGLNGEHRRFTYVSAGVEKIHGITADQVMADPFLLYSQLLDEDRNYMVRKEIEALKNFNPLKVEVRFRAPSGDIRWIFISSAPRRANNGHIIWDGIEFDITERKLMEESLRLSEEKYRSVLSNTSLVSFVLDDKGNFLLSEGKSLTKLGLKPGQVVGLNVADVYKDFPEIISICNRSLNGETLREEISVIGIVFDVLLTPIVDSSGRVKKVIGIANDITDAKRAKDELLHSYAQNKALIAAIPDLMFVLTKDMVFDDFYSTSESDLIASPDSFLGHNIDEILPEYLAELTKKHVLELFRTNENQFFEYQIELNGKVSLYEARMAKVDDYKAITLCRDITERKKSEEAAELERAYFEQLFAGSPEGIVVLDANDCVIRCNEEFTKMFGFSQEEARGLQINSLIVPENLADEGLQLTNSVYKGMQVTHETIRKHKDGTLIPVSILGKPIQFKGGQIAVYGIYRDITERKKIEQELMQKNFEIEAQNEEYRIINEELHKAKEKAEESDRLKSAFLANMSHEIRTPMNGILGFSQLLVNPEITEKDTDQYVDIIQSCGNQLLTIINDLIDISKIEANQIVINESEINVNQLLNEQFVLFEKKAQSIGIDFSFSPGLSDNQSNITTDGARLKQIISNLLSNALKFIRNGFVKFGYSLEGNKLLFFVEDTGIGIPDEFHELIFERFRQVETKLSAQAGGTGLGLAISKAYINKMGGELWVKSEPEKGSTFYFTVPYKPIVKEFFTERETAQLISADTFTAATFLIAEDDDVNYYYLSELLNEFNVNLIRATSGSQAIDLIKGNTDIDLVLMDIKMPGLDGYEATRQIKMIRNNLPVIAQTAYAFSSDREKALEYGCDDYIAKPIDKNKLLTIIARYISGRKEY